jgi:TP901 family phage tail tape measure protein
LTGGLLDRAFVELGYETRDFDRGLEAAERSFDRSVRAMTGRAVRIAFDEGDLTKTESLLGEISTTAGIAAGAAGGIAQALARGAGPIGAMQAGFSRALSVAVQLGVALAKHLAIQKALEKAVEAARASQRPMLADALQAVKTIHKYAGWLKLAFAGALLPVKALGAGLSQAARLARDVGGGIASGLGAMAPGLFLGGAAGLGAALGFAVKSAADFEQGLAQVRKTTGLAGDELEALSAGIKDLATALPGISSAELLEIAAAGGRLGIQGGAEILAYTKAVGMMGIALDGLPVEEAATGVATLLNVFKLGTDRTLGLASALNKLDDTSNTTARAILDITTRAAATANGLGVTATETMALAAALASAGVNAEEAGTALSQILARMTSNLEEFAAMAGKSSAEFAATIRRDPVEALRQVAEGINRLDPILAASKLEELGLDGTRTANAMKILAANFGQVERYVRDANEEFATGASIQREVAVAAELFWNKLKGLWEQVRQLAAVFGSALLPALGAASDHLSRFVGMLADNAAGGGALGAFKDALVGAVDVLAGLAERPMEALDVLMAGFDLLALKVEQAAGEAAVAMVRKFQEGFGILNKSSWAEMLFGKEVALMAAVAGDIGKQKRGEVGERDILGARIGQAERRLNEAIAAAQGRGAAGRAGAAAERAAGRAVDMPEPMGPNRIGGADEALKKAEEQAAARAGLEAGLSRQIAEGFGAQFIAEEMEAVRRKVEAQLQAAKDSGLLDEGQFQALKKKLGAEMSRREALAEIEQRRADVVAGHQEDMADLERQRQEVVGSAMRDAWADQGKVGFAGGAEDLTRQLQQAIGDRSGEDKQLQTARRHMEISQKQWEAQRKTVEELQKLNRAQAAEEDI